MQQGDIVLCVNQGDYGKPRPAVIVQSNLFNETHSSITVCPLTTHPLIDANLFRITVEPSSSSGLNTLSHVMVDKITTIKKEKISKKIGTVSSTEQQKITAALKLWLAIN